MRRPNDVPSLALALAAALLLGGCGLLRPGEEPRLVTALTRCELDAEPSAAYRTASRSLIDAARDGRVAVANDRLLVAYDRTISSAEDVDGATALRRSALATLRAEHGLTRLRTIAPGLELVRVADDPWARAERMLDDPRVRYAHPNVRLAPHDVPNDPRFDEQWHLTSFGLPRAWDVEPGEASVTLAVIDAGFALEHPEFAGRLESGWDFHDRDDDPSSASVHGTHVAGIAIANRDDGLGVAGVAGDGVRMLPIKVFDDAGNDSRGDAITAVVDGIRWAAGYDVDGPERRAAPVDVVNLSLGTAGSYTLVPALEEAIRDARRRDVLVFVSTGNEGGSAGVTAPANGPCAIAVGSVDEDMRRSSFSNYDADEPMVDLVAPGGYDGDGRSVLSTAPDDGYARLAGTSMAAPFAAGAAALLASHHPEWSAADLLERLLASAHAPPGSNPMQIGFGVACPDAALNAGTTCGRP